MAPMPVGARIDTAPARRITAGCRAVGASHILATNLADTSGTTSRLPADADCTGIRPPFLHPRRARAAQQLALLGAFTQGTCAAPDFAHGWWTARRASQANGERIQGALGDLFDQVFMILEDYAVDPDLAEPGDLDDAGLRTAVRTAWEACRRR
ncbi:hypothetical protein ACFYO5_33560 [Streptomyces sp. NPDC006259]|uniref:hypothetical protein n=1 Tax=Streptomyces sp. NPDC006259 TaxID=3364740 RepID=UPI0036992AC9